MFLMTLATVQAKQEAEQVGEGDKSRPPEDLTVDGRLVDGVLVNMAEIWQMLS